MNHPKARWAKNLGDNRWKYKWLVNLWTSTITLEMQIKTMRCHFKLIILANFKNTLKLWIRIGRNTQECNWKNLSKLKIFISSELAALLLEIYAIEKFTLKYIDIYIHYSAIYNNKKQKTPQQPTRGEQTMVYSYNNITIIKSKEDKSVLTRKEAYVFC